MNEIPPWMKDHQLADERAFKKIDDKFDDFNGKLDDFNNKLDKHMEMLNPYIQGVAGLGLLWKALAAFAGLILLWAQIRGFFK